MQGLKLCLGSVLFLFSIGLLFVGISHAAPKAKKKEEPPITAGEAYKRGDYARALKMWEKMAENNDAQAMNNLGILYDRGLGVPVDVGRALHWFALSAKGNNPEGMSNYGWMLEQGRGIEQNFSEAARWYDKAARAGQVEAQYNLGLLYERGQGVPRDLKAAAAWFSRAASKQQTEALARLGHFYREGFGVPKDASKAQLLLYAAAMEGHEGAIAELAEMAPEDASSRGIALFGQRMDQTNRKKMRKALKDSGVPEIRLDDKYICDIYDVRKIVPGAQQMTVCYGPKEADLGFLKIDYKASSQELANQIQSMVASRFGKPQAVESTSSSLWNMGTVVIATQYMPKLSVMSLMYMVPKIYHLTNGRR
ncbi:MAG: sel1 repeat family protein [Desulfovibrio sp.]|nr:sel1 repeat family protein [Desulfovibrio sp.]